MSTISLSSPPVSVTRSIKIMGSSLVALIAFLFSSPATPVFVAGDRVNLIQRGIIMRTDGYVLAQTPQGVLVEFNNTGHFMADPVSLCRIG